MQVANVKSWGVVPTHVCTCASITIAEWSGTKLGMLFLDW